MATASSLVVSEGEHVILFEYTAGMRSPAQQGQTAFGDKIPATAGVVPEEKPTAIEAYPFVNGKRVT
jgi:hypothetical protein